MEQNNAELVTAERPVAIGARTLLGDLMVIVVDELKAATDLWHRLSEAEQEAVVARLERRCSTAVTEVVGLIAAEGRLSIDAVVESVTFKDGVRAVLKLPAGRGAHALADSTKLGIRVVFPDAQPHMGGARPAADPQQPELALEDVQGAIESGGRAFQDAIDGTGRSPAADAGESGDDAGDADGEPDAGDGGDDDR